jgi:hypothetical protein
LVFTFIETSDFNPVFFIKLIALTQEWSPQKATFHIAFLIIEGFKSIHSQPLIRTKYYLPAFS